MKFKLKPSARINRRYFLINEDFEEGIKKIIIDYIGILGWAKAAPVFVKEVKGLNGKIVLAINRGEINNFRAAFELSNSNIKILKVSGTLKGLGKR